MAHEGYVVSTFLAICAFVENISGNSLMRGELSLDKSKFSR